MADARVNVRQRRVSARLCVAAGLLLFVAACGGPPDTATAPEVTATDPTGGATGVAQTDDIVVSFSEPMNESVTEAAFSASPDMNCDFSWNGSSTQLTCDPQTNLSPGTSYTVTIATGAASAEGETLEAAHDFSFTTAGTAGAPFVVATSPADGDAVGPNVNVVVTFSEEMNEGSVESAFNASPALTCTFSWNAASTRLTCDPDGGLASNESYAITIGGAAQAASGESLDGDFTLSFDTTDTALEACQFGASTLGACVLD